MAVLLGAAAAALGLAACSGSSTQGLGQLTGVGVVRVTPSHGRAHLVHAGYTFHAADAVQVVDGDATIDLAPSGTVVMRPGTSVVLGATLRLVSGDILVQPAGHSIQVSTPQATLVASGAAQLAMPTPGDLGVKVYQSTANLELAGSAPVTIAAPRQVVLSAQTKPPIPVVPLQYRDDDTWDHMYLAQAEQVSAQLAAAATGFNAQVPAADALDVAFYQALLPQLSGRGDFVQAFDAVSQQQQATPGTKSMAGDYLMASIIALRGTRGSLQDRMSGELAFFAQGAPWGFVAYDQGVTDLAGVLSDVLGAIGRATLPFSATSPQIALPPLATTTPTTVPPTKTPTSTPTVSTPPPISPATVPTVPTKPGGPTTTTLPALIQLPVPVLGGALGNVLNPLLDPIIQTLNNILAGKG